MKITENEKTYKTISIELTESEAAVLGAVCCCIGGNPTGPRRVTEKIAHNILCVFEDIVRYSISDIVDRSKPASIYLHSTWPDGMAGDVV